MSHRVVFLQKAPTPYNDHLFRALANDPRVALQVYYLWPSTSARPWKCGLGQGYPAHWMRLRFGIDWGFVRRSVRDRDCLYIVADWAHLATVAVLLARLACGLPVGLRVDTPQEQLPRRQPKKWLRAQFLRWLLPRVNTILATSQPAFRALVPLGARHDQLVDFPFYVPLEPLVDTTTDVWPLVRRQLRARVGCPDEGLVFVMAGTITDKKGMDIGIRAFAEFRRQCSLAAGLLIAGDGPQRGAMEALVRELGMSSCVSILGWQEPEQLDAVLLAGDALIHAARYDPFPVAVLDAMRLGRPVIGSDACGSVEARVRNRENGLVVPAGDVAALTAALIEIGQSPECLPRWGQAARQTARQWPVARGVETICQQLVRWVPSPNGMPHAMPAGPGNATHPITAVNGRDLQ